LDTTTGDFTLTGAITTLNMSLGRGITSAAAESIITSGAVTTLALTSSLNNETIEMDSGNDLGYGGSNNHLLEMAGLTKATYQHTGTGAMKWVGSAISVSNNVSSTATSSTADTIEGGAGNDTLTGNLGANVLTGNAGNDVIVAGAGADTVDGGAGNDTLTLTESSSAADVVKIANGGASFTEVAGVGNDTGLDTITGFDTAADLLTITATGVVDYVHGENSNFRKNATAASGDAVTDLAASAFSFDFNGDADFIDSGVDMVINMGGLATSGVAYVTNLAGSDTALEATLAYDLTGTAAADVMIGGDLADVFDGGLQNDTITGGGGADTIAVGGGVDTVLYNSILDGSALITLTNVTNIADDFAATAGTTVDSITSDWAVASDFIKIGTGISGLLENGGTTVVSANAGTALNYNIAGIFIMSGTAGTMAADNFGDITVVVATFAAGNGTVANANAGDEILFSIEGNTANLTGLYYFKDVDGNGEISNGDQLALLAIIADDTITGTELTLV